MARNLMTRTASDIARRGMLSFRRWPAVFALFATMLASLLVTPRAVQAQAGLREALLRMDRNEDGQISREEITPLARPYLERIARERRMDLNRPNEINRLLDAARVYYATKNGTSGRDIQPGGTPTVLPFGPEQNRPLVPEFGLPAVRYRYVQADLDEADSTLRRYDSNRDGFIDVVEAQRNRWTHRDPFNMDLNQDGRLSRIELTQRYARRRMLDGTSEEVWQQARRTGGLVSQDRRVQRLGDDERRERDERRRREESEWWRRGGNSTWLTATLLSRFDNNKNGRLEANEAANLRLPTSLIDIDRDGELTRAELHEYLAMLQEAEGETSTALPGWFYELDANRDEQIAMSEFTDEWTPEKLAEFESFDTNGDGLLTELEVGASRAAVGGSYANEDAQVLPPRKTVISEIEVAEDYLIADLNVRVGITHTSVGQLDGYLTGPDGQRIELFTEIGRTDDHFEDTIFDDQSRAQIVKARPPYRGSFVTEGASKGQPGLGHFNGKNVNGVWQLVIRGTRSDRFGMLHRWGLLVRPREELRSESRESSQANVRDESNNQPPNKPRRDGT